MISSKIKESNLAGIFRKFFMADKTVKNESNVTEKLIEVGADIAGNTSSAAVSFLLAGPMGALVGAISGPAITHTLKHVASEIKSRFLGKGLNKESVITQII